MEETGDNFPAEITNRETDDMFEVFHVDKSYNKNT